MIVILLLLEILINKNKKERILWIVDRILFILADY